MLHRGVALLGIFTLAPAHASLIEYSFTSTVTNLGGNVHEDFGVEIGDTLAGGFLFDDAALRTSYAEESVVGFAGWASGVVSTSTYDMSNLLAWAIVGDHRVSSMGDLLSITDAPNLVYYPDVWRLQTHGDGQATNGYLVEWMQFCLQEWFIGPLTSSDLQVSNASDWGYGAMNHWFGISFVDGSSIYSDLQSITRTSVPEPATLSLLGVGALGLLATRRRRRDIEA